MAAVVASTSTSNGATDSTASTLSWSTALVLLDAASVTGSVAPSAAAFVSANRTQLERPYDPFSSTTDKPTGSTAALVAKPAVAESPPRKQLAQAVADRFNVDTQLASRAVQSALSTITDKGKGKGKEKVQERDQLSEDEWDRVTAWVFEERMAVIGVVALFLRTHDDESHPCYELASELLPSILTDSFCPTLLASFASRTSQSLPEAVRASPSHALFWTRQLICEQKALLELVFLAYYSPRPARGADLVSVLDSIRATEWGQRQHLFGYFDSETQAVTAEIGHLLTVLAVEAMNLESAMEQDYPIGAPGEQGVDKESLFAPENLVKANEAVESVVRIDNERAAPILLGWAFILSKVTTSLLERGVPEAYHAFAEQSLRVDVPVSGSTARSPRTTTQPLFQLYAAHALAPSSSLFPVLGAILQSSLLGAASGSTADPNAVGYISVLRGLVTSLPNLVRLTFLSAEQLEALYEVFAALYGSPAAALLCAHFWEDQAVVASAAAAHLDSDLEASISLLNRTAQNSGEAEIVDLARSRFPVQFGGLVKLVRALCAGVNGLLPVDHALNGTPADASNDNELLAAKCAQTIFAYLATLPTLTHIAPTGPGVTPLPYEAAAYPDPATGYAFRVVRPIGVSRSVAIPTGTQGRLVSANGSKPIVVAWDVEWSAWRLFADMLEDYAGLGHAGSKRVRADVFGSKEALTDRLPMEWDSEDDRERDVTAVLDIMRATLQNDHALAPVLVEHLSTAPGHQTTSTPRHDLVEVLFRILERSLAPKSTRPASTALVSSLVGLIAALLPSFPGVVWTFLRGSTLLFPSLRTNGAYGRSAASFTAAASSPLLQAEKLTGRYPVTVSLLSLVHKLVLEEQVASCVTSPEYREVKRGVLVRALKWVRDDVWPVFGSWRYATLAEKYALSRSCIQLFRLVLEQAQVDVAKPSSADPVVQVVTDAFITPKATVAQLAPVLSTLSSGPDGIILLRKAGRYADAQALEDLVDSALGLVLDLLRLRRRTKSLTTSLLEKLCLSPASTASYSAASGPRAFGFSAVLSGQEPTRRPELLESLARYIVAPLDTRLAVQAAQIVTLVCLASTAADDGSRGAVRINALLGGGDGGEAILKALLSLAEDHLAVSELQVAVWDLISAIVDSQPGLAMLVVTGRAYPFSTETDIVMATKDDKGKSTEPTPAEKSAQDLAKSLAPKPPQPLPRTAIGVALETIGTWSDAWERQPAVLAAVLRFFDFVWQHLVDYGTALDDLRNKSATWETLVKIAFASTGAEPTTEEDIVAHCYRTTARAHAARIVALNVQATMSKPKGKVEETASAKALLSTLGDPRQVTSLLSAAIATSCAPSLHSGTYELVEAAFPSLDLDGLRNVTSTHALDESRVFGAGYLFALPMVRRRLDGYLADSEQMHGQESLDDAVRQVVKLNLNFSLLEAQVLDTRSWRQLLETVAPIAQSRQNVADSVVEGIKLVATEIADEMRGGEVMETVQAERLSILLVLVQLLEAGSVDKVKASSVELLTSISKIFASETLAPLESIVSRAPTNVHGTLFRTAFFAVRLATSHFSDTTTPAERKSQLCTAIESILRHTLTALRDILVLARSSKDSTLEQDLSLATAVLTQLLRSPFLPAAPVWLAQLHSLDLLRAAFEVLVHMDVGADGRPLYAHHVLDLCLAFATSSPRAAEQLALEGVMTALTNNALTAAAEAGAIALVSPVEPVRTVQHELWTAELRLVVALIAALGDSTRFVEQDVTGFVRLYGLQFIRALEWTSDAPVTLAGLEELAAVVAIMHGVARASTSSAVAGPAGSTPSNSPVVAVARVFVEQSLHLLQHIVYALLHPNHLAAQIEGLSPEERARLDKEANSIAEVEKRPIASLVAGKMAQLARDVVAALVAYGDAWSTLLRDPFEWRTDRACVALTATVTSSEPASVGTLFDLVSFAIDTLRSPPPAPPTAASSTANSANPIDLVSVCSETLESTLLLVTSQLLLHSAALANGSTVSSHGHAHGHGLDSNDANTSGGSTTSGGTPAEKHRALLELASDAVELLDKAAVLPSAAAPAPAASGGAPTPTTTPPAESRKRLAEVLKSRLTVWVQGSSPDRGGNGTGGGNTD